MSRKAAPSPTRKTPKNFQVRANTKTLQDTLRVEVHRDNTTAGRSLHAPLILPSENATLNFVVISHF
jgi:hypothetical protein